MEPIQAHLQQLLQQDHLPHAILLSSPQIDVMSLCAREFAQVVLCEKQNACGHCHACQLFLAGSHPDFISLAPEGKSQSIRIDSIRHLSDSLHEKSSIGRFRVVIIEQCEAMNAHSANALLKSLEEPGADSLLLLTTRNHQALLQTIRSRCQLVYHADQQADVVDQAFLEAVLGNDFLPDRAAALPEDSSFLVEQCQRLMLAVIREQQGVSQRSEEPIQKLASSIDSDSAFEFLDKCARLKAALAHKVTLNHVLLAEDLLIDWQRLRKGETHALAFEPV